MDTLTKRGFFPGFPLFTGMLGFGLRCWLLSTADDQGLLQAGHWAGALVFILFALTLAACILKVQPIALADSYQQLFPTSELAAIGTAIGAIGIAYTAFTVDSFRFLQILLPLAGLLSAAALLISAYCRMKGLRPNFLLHGIVAVYLILRTLSGCQTWGAEPQLHLYFFQLFSCLFLLIACYFRAELDLASLDCRKYVFFSQAALFCCCLCLPEEDWIFYLSAGIWLATDYCALPAAKSS